MSKAKESATLNPPEFLDDSAKAKFSEMVAGGGYGAEHADNLGAYCANWSRWRKAEQWLSDPAHGTVVTIKDDKGNIKSHAPAPQLKVSADAAKEMARLMKLIPAPRAPVKQTKTKPIADASADVIAAAIKITGDEGEAAGILNDPMPKEIAKLKRVLRGKSGLRWMVAGRNLLG